ncbi:MAG TPA: hypothetical protein DCO75_08465, partial [Fibrobacteres bacterium]|nr:hypothetical protein [Fibrobacterota bacterium]
MQLYDNKDVGEIKKALSHCVREYVFARILDDFLGTGTVFLGLLFIIQVVFAVFPWIILPVLWYGAIIFFAVFVIITIIYKCFIHPPSHLFIADFL